MSDKLCSLSRGSDKLKSLSDIKLTHYPLTRSFLYATAQHAIVSAELASETPDLALFPRPVIPLLVPFTSILLSIGF